MMPWKILESTQGYIFTWLIGYSALLGPIAGIMIVDYYFVRGTRLDVPQLYREDGAYAYPVAGTSPPSSPSWPASRPICPVSSTRRFQRPSRMWPRYSRLYIPTPGSSASWWRPSSMAC